LTSPGHNSNMLNPAWRVIGVGQTGRMWVVDFGTTDDSGEPWDTGAGPPQPASTPAPSGRANPTATPFAGFPTQNTGGSGVQSAAPAQPTVPGAVRTVLPADSYAQHELPSNVPVKRAMMQMIAAE
jgi:hypothetical protein